MHREGAYFREGKHMAKTAAEQIAANAGLEKPDDDDLDTDVEELDDDEDAEDEDTPAAADADTVDEDDLPDAVKAILKKNRQALRDAEKRAKTAERALAKKGDDKPDTSDADAKAEKYRGLVVKAHAKAALLEAGLTSAPDRFVRMLDLDAIEVDDDGNVDGLEEQIDDIKDDFPDLFGEKETPRRRAPRVSASDKKAAPQPKDSASTLAKALVGR